MPWLQQKCLIALQEICGRQTLLPRSLQIPLCYNQSDTPLHRGGYADLWKGEHQGSHVAVKVLRVSSESVFGEVMSVSSHDLSKVYAGQLMLVVIGALQGDCDVESPSPSKRAPAVGGDNGQLSDHDSIRVDDKWEH